MGRRERPLDPAAGPLQEFARELRQLRLTAGGRPYRELARHASFSASALSAAASGRAFPSLEVTLAYVSACGGDPVAWRQRWQRLRGDAETADESPTAAEPTPVEPVGGTGSGATDFGAPLPAPVGPAAHTHADARHRARLLACARRYWVDAVLDPAMERAGRLPLRLLADRPADGGADVVDSGQLRRLFERSLHLVILGDCGSGKSTLLLELLRELLLACAGDDDHPMPLLLPLAGWDDRSRRLDDWLVRELTRLYGVDARRGRAWVAERAVLPLLDGLDAVPGRRRSACVTAIEEYRHARGAAYPLVVTCRTGVYRALGDPLAPRETVQVRRLAVNDVRARLDAGGPRLARIRAAIEADPALRQTLTGPGFLAAATRLGAEGRAASTGPGRPPRRVVLGAYLEHRLRTAPGSPPYDAAEILAGLGWLARAMPGRGAFISTAALAAPTRWLRGRRTDRPRHLRAFLHHAHMLGLLDECDGGYRFVHPLLREHVSGAPDSSAHWLARRRPPREGVRLCRAEPPASRAPAA